jgi:hypothetical protein
LLDQRHVLLQCLTFFRCLVIFLDLFQSRGSGRLRDVPLVVDGLGQQPLKADATGGVRPRSRATCDVTSLKDDTGTWRGFEVFGVDSTID